MNRIGITGNELRGIMSDYAFNDDIMCEDPQKVRVAKIALSRLNESDRIIFCLALDQESSRKVGKILGVSHSTVLKQLKRIRRELLYQVMEVLKTEDLED